MEKDLELGKEAEGKEETSTEIDVDIFGYSDFATAAFTALSALELIDKQMHKGVSQIERDCVHILRKSISEIRKVIDG